MTTRREVLKAGAALALAGTGGPAIARASQAASAPADEKRPKLRTITYNVLACTGYHGKKEPQPGPRPMIPREQMAARFALELSLYQPDVVSFQESPGEPMVAEIAERMGLKHHSFFPSGQSWPGAIMTRYRIVESANCPLKSFADRPKDLFTRHWGRAVLETPAGALVMYSTHLYPGVANANRREPEVTEMLKVMADDLRANRSLLLQGDLNHRPDGPEYQRWAEAGLVDTFARKGVGQPYTVTSEKPHGRIDYIWAHGPLAERLQQCRVLYEGAFRTNPEDPGSVALSDHVPVLADFD